jgi:hypothetical protein
VPSLRRGLEVVVDVKVKCKSDKTWRNEFGGVFTEWVGKGG